MKKKYTSAPLPFQGQKRKFNKEFREVLKQCPEDTTFVDLFGGSGLLSHITKNEKPNAKVIYNDFDNYRKRLEAIPTTNKILKELRKVLYEYPRKVKISNIYKSQVLQVLRKWNDENIYIDWITLSSSLLFSANYATSFEEFTKETLYSKVRISDYNIADDYLNGIDVVSCNYKLLFDKYKNQNNVVYLIDPPYLSTDTTTYSSNSYWKLTDYLEVLNTVNGTNYIYFTSDKSNIIELCEWLETTTLKGNPFKDAKRLDLKASISKSASYTDTMLFKWNRTSTNDV